jgi:hypothetical protein
MRDSIWLSTRPGTMPLIPPPSIDRILYFLLSAMFEFFEITVASIIEHHQINLMQYAFNIKLTSAG